MRFIDDYEGALIDRMYRSLYRTDFKGVYRRTVKDSLHVTTKKSIDNCDGVYRCLRRSL